MSVKKRRYRVGNDESTYPWQPSPDDIIIPLDKFIQEAAAQEKDFQYFKDEVARENGLGRWRNSVYCMQFVDEAARRYAQYLADLAFIEGVARERARAYFKSTELRNPIKSK